MVAVQFSAERQEPRQTLQRGTSDPCASSWRSSLLVSEIVSTLPTGLQHMCPKADTPCRMPPSCLAGLWAVRHPECKISRKHSRGECCCPVARRSANADCFVRRQCTHRRDAQSRRGSEVLFSPSVQWKQWKLVVRLVRMFCSQSHTCI